jgi:hypothetical protein
MNRGVTVRKKKDETIYIYTMQSRHFRTVASEHETSVLRCSIEDYTVHGIRMVIKGKMRTTKWEFTAVKV